MRILFFSHYFPPEGNAPASRTHQNCRRWVAAGHQVTVITCAPNQPAGVVYEGYRNRLFSRETIDGIDVIRVWTYIAANKGTLLRIFNYVSYLISAVLRSLFLRRPDLVIATSPQFFCGWAGVIASWLRRTPFILEIRDLWPDSIVAVGAMKNRRLLGLLEWLEHRMYAAADHIVTVGEGYREELSAKGVAAERMTVIMNGIDRDVFSPREPDAALARELGVEGKFVVSYSGTIGMACGLEVVLRAAAMLRERGRDEVVFLLVGDGAQRESLAAQAREAGLDNVILTGRQDRGRMPAFLSISDASLVHLKKTDLFRTVMPSKIFESAGMKRPIIIGVAGHAERIVLEAGAGIAIEPENAEQLVAAVERLADDAALRERLGQSGHDHITTYYDRDRLAADYLKTIEQVAARRGESQ